MRLKKIAIGVALASGTMAAQAGDVLFFPYVVAGGSVTTLVSVVNGATAAMPGVQYFNNNGTTRSSFSPDHRYLHWVYNVKSSESPTAICNDFNGYFPTSPLDVVTYDVSAVRGNNGLMFEDPVATSNLATGKNAFGALPLASGKRATLFVHNASSENGAPALTGDALILEFDTGAAWGYAALENHTPGASGETAATLSENFDFSWVGGLDSDISFDPQDEITTRIFITPVNNGAPTQPSMLGNFGAQLPISGNFQTSVQLTTPVNGGSSISVFDRDESGFSSTNPLVPVTCVYPVDLIQHGSIPGLISSPNVIGYVEDTGGWTHITSFGDPTIAIKLDFRAGGAGGKFEMPANTGALNNSYVLNPPYRRPAAIVE